MSDGWISTREALPPIGEEFLAVVAGKVTTAVRTERDRWAHRIDTGTETFQISIGRPTLWMPLPGPPKPHGQPLASPAWER
jgi:hypothetical protein